MTDLPVTTVPGQEYGAQAEQAEAQRVVPMGAAPTPGLQRRLPTPLTAPSERPDEPVQAGLPLGPGPGPEALGAMDPDQVTVETLRALRRKYPSRALDRLLMQMER